MPFRGLLFGALALLFSCCLGACGRSNLENAAETARDSSAVVVLTLSSSPNLLPGQIQGQIVCEDPWRQLERRPLPVIDQRCIQDPSTLARAVLQCGSPTVTIDTRYTHVTHVYFASAPGSPVTRNLRSDFEIVRCVQQQVGFRFFAGTADRVENLAEAVRRPFADLYEAEQQAE